MPPITPVFNAIAAIGQSGQMGLNGQLPWNCPEDFRVFRTKTAGQTLIVGRRTLDTLPPLKGRKLLVLTSNGRYVPPSHHEDVTLIPHLREAPEGAWIIGGAEVYRKALPYITNFWITRIDYDGPADTYFPFRTRPPLPVREFLLLTCQRIGEGAWLEQYARWAPAR